MYSKLQPGDKLRSINGKKIGPSFTAQQAEAYMVEQSQKDGLLSIAVGNDAGDDTLVQATVLKPSPSTTCADLGMVVWFWGGLCIKSIDNNSLFASSVLKANDRIVSVNDILCERVNPEQFERVVNELPLEITVVVKRGKQRWNGQFG